MNFCEDIKVKYSEMDYKLSLKPSALLNFLQDMASQNAENLGFGYSYIEKRRLSLKISYGIFRLPGFGL